MGAREPGRGRRAARVAWGLAAAAIFAIAFVLIVPADELAPGQVLWFRAPRGLATSPGPAAVLPAAAFLDVPLHDAPDGRDLPFEVKGLAGDPLIGCCVNAGPRPGLLASLVARFRAPGPPAPEILLMPVRSTTTATGTWVGCVADVSALGAEWHPADMAGAWVHEGRADGETLGVTFRPDGAVVRTATSAPCGRWAEGDGHLFVRWDQGLGTSFAFRVESFRMAADRRSYARMFDAAPSRGGRRE